mmetsp:Transcript_36614/g.105332  ORF Transcript_36614/g.105332 Transcript_36614/m.105332 type:complete len:522 (+) Transcript_36614:87-1652(+)
MRFSANAEAAPDAGGCEQRAPHRFLVSALMGRARSAPPPAAHSSEPPDISRIKRETLALHPYVATGLEERGCPLFAPPEAKRFVDGALFFLPGSDGAGDEDYGEVDEVSCLDATPIEIMTPVRPLEASQARKLQYMRSRSDKVDADFSPCMELKVNIRSDDFFDPKHCLPSGGLKPRRPTPHMTASELLNGLKLSDKSDEYVFEGLINGWGAYSNLVLQSIIIRRRAVGRYKESVLWAAGEGKPLPSALQLARGAHAVFMAPAWTAIGWAPDSPGFVWWYTDMPGEPRLLFGESMQRELDHDDEEFALAIATDVHAFAHRYAKQAETFRDANTWHTGLLIEWSHRQFCTVVEVGFMHGVSGYGGKSNWFADKNDPNPILYQVMPESLKKPYDERLSEVRLTNVRMKDKDEFFEKWLLKYSNLGDMPPELHRFFDPTIFTSGQIRIRDCTPSQIAVFCLNYISRAGEYGLMTANCQTFAADFYGFLTGTQGVAPFSKFLRAGYQQRTMSFLYRPTYTEKPLA